MKPRRRNELDVAAYSRDEAIADATKIRKGVVWHAYIIRGPTRRNGPLLFRVRFEPTARELQAGNCAGKTVRK